MGLHKSLIANPYLSYTYTLPTVWILRAYTEYPCLYYAVEWRSYTVGTPLLMIRVLGGSRRWKLNRPARLIH
jgi:hypothetical protein